MPTTPLTNAQKVTVLKHLINGRDIDFITPAVHITPDQVNDVKRDHGYPDDDKMRWAADILTKKDNAIPTQSAPSTGGHALDRPRPPVHAAQTPPAAATPAADQPITLSATKILDLGDKSPKQRTRNLSAKIRTLLNTLTAALHDEREDTEKAKRIAQLQAELDALKGTIKKNTPAAAGPDAKTIRAWAAAHDIPCTTVGVVPAAVRDQYEHANGNDAA